MAETNETAAGAALNTAGATTRERGPRSDALRNRAALLEAARQVFRERGLAAQMDEVAARAGLGVGTLYRHFPTKEALVDVVVRERYEAVVEVARAALRAEDPWEGLTTFLWRLAELDAEDRTIADLMVASNGRTDFAPFFEEIGNAVQTLARRAQRSGAMRRDVTGHEAMTAVCAITRHQHESAGRTEAGTAGAWRRLVRVVIDGLRVPVAPGTP